MKSIDSLMHINVIMLTGLSKDEMIKNCLSLGALAVLQKPFDENLFEKICREKEILSELLTDN